MYGIPTKINSDSGTEFNNELIKKLMGMHKIDLHIGTPNNPNSMGVVKRFHSTKIGEIPQKRSGRCVGDDLCNNGI